MSNDLVINPQPAPFYFHKQLPFNKPHKGIRSSQKSNIFYSKVSGTAYHYAEQEILIQEVVFGKTRPSPVATTHAGGIEPQSNSLCDAVNPRLRVRQRQAAITHSDDMNRRRTIQLPATIAFPSTLRVAHSGDVNRRCTIQLPATLAHFRARRPSHSIAKRILWTP